MMLETWYVMVIYGEMIYDGYMMIHGINSKKIYKK